MPVNPDEFRRLAAEARERTKAVEAEQARQARLEAERQDRLAYAVERTRLEICQPQSQAEAAMRQAASRGYLGAGLEIGSYHIPKSLLEYSGGV